ncbi:MAG: hypothetical protein AB9835_11710 [Eubacteriales bacterium]
MSTELVNSIRIQTDVLFTNASIMLRTCRLDFVLCDMPIWKHVYHMLHSCDRWFINPNEYTEPDFHVPDLNSLDIASDITLSREQLSKYLDEVQDKITQYIDSLTDEALCEVPAGCVSNRLGLILSQYRHFYTHLGNINATTIMETNEWPRVIGSGSKSGKATEHLFE